MADDPENHLRLLRRIDANMQRVVEDVRDIKVRMTAVEEAVVGVNRRIDRVEARLDRIGKRRLELVDEPTG